MRDFVPIGRRQPGSRLLPPISQDMYENAVGAGEGTAPFGRSILALGTHALPFRKRVLGRRLSTEERVQRLVWLHAQGFAAECGGQRRRADYFWDLVLRDMRSMWWDRASWTTPYRGVPNLPVRLLDELLIDTHCAFYNGCATTEQASDEAGRAFRHAERVIALTALQEGAQTRYREILGPIHEARAAAHENRRCPRLAIPHRTALSRLFPHDEARLKRLLTTHVQAAVAELSDGTTESACRADAMKLRRAVDVLEQQRRAQPQVLAYYEALAHLCHLRAVRLGRALAPSEALLAVEQALTYDPDLREAATTRDDLRQLLDRLTEQLRAVEALPGRRRQLSEQGARIRADIRNGLTPVAQYLASTDARQLAEQRTVAQDLAMWRTLGLAAPTDGLRVRTEALVWAATTLLQLDPYTPQRAVESWADLRTKAPLLAEVNPDPVLRFVHRRRTGEEEAAVTQPLETIAPADPPQLVSPPAAPRQRGEPFALWLWSRRDMRLKALAAAAVAALVAVGGVSLVDATNRADRDTAYSRMVAAAGHGDDVAVMDAAAGFLTNRPLNADDDRADRVLDLYAESFVHWFTAQDDVGSPGVQDRIIQYRDLTADGH